MTYQEWLEEWLIIDAKPTRKARTFERYASIARRYLMPALGAIPMSALTPHTLQRFSAELISRSLSPRTINSVLSVLNLSLHTAARMGVLPQDASFHIQRAKETPEERPCLSEKTQRYLEQYILDTDHPRLRGILLCLYTGLRVGELLALTWEDIDLAQGMLYITKSCHDSWQNGVYLKIIEAPKTAHSVRQIPLPRQLLPLLRAWKREQSGSYVVTGRTGEGASVRSYQRSFSLLLDRLGLPHCGMHTLRHTFATRALEQGMDARCLSELLGHANPGFTLKQYGHSLLEHKRRLMDRLGNSIQKRFLPE